MSTYTVWMEWRNGASLVERGLRTMQAIATTGSPEDGKNLLAERDGKYREAPWKRAANGRVG
jgi:hypothetical protein